MRIGAKKKPFYRVVVLDERAKRTGAYIELLGTYNPLTEPKDIKLKKDRIDYWIKQGAQPSTGYLRIIGKAPQRPPRKPKKEKKTEEPSAISDQTSEKKVQGEEPVKKVAGEETKSEAEKPQDATEVKSESEITQEAPNNENEEVVDDSAEKPESKESEMSESVQKEDERPA